MTAGGRWMAVAREADVPEGEALGVAVGGERLVLCRVDGEVYALEDTCPHDGGELSAGRIEDHVVECPRHGARFDVRTGAVLRMPAPCGVRTFPARVVGGTVEVCVGEDGPCR